MNWGEVQAHWTRLSDPIRARWSELTTDDLDEAHGNRAELAQIIHERYGFPRTEADRQIEAWLVGA